MPAAALRKSIVQDIREPKQDVAPGDRNLYYRNTGLFSDPYLNQLSSGKHSDLVLRNWDTEALPDFDAAYSWMTDTWAEMKDILPTLSEAQLEDKWIKPILQKLGWEYEVQDRLKKWGKTEIPDYSLFDSKKTYLKAQGCKTDEAYFSHVLAVADAKQMGISLDGSKLDKSNPSYQIVWYQQITGREWGILTDGRYWRLYSTRAKSRFNSYFEVNIEKFLVERDNEKFKYFFNFFRKEAFVKSPDSGQSFLDFVFENGVHYAKEVETRLKERAFQLVEMIAKGFAGSRTSPSKLEMEKIYRHSLYYLFRLMFILNCEAKGLLSVDRQSDYYPNSLRSLCLKLREEFEANQVWSRPCRSYNHISDLFKLLQDGDDKIGIHGFGTEVFSAGDVSFYEKNPISDETLNKVLLELAFAEEKREKNLQLIDYKRLSADHLGSLFEGLLEYKLESQGKGLILVNTKGERKAAGAFYTPDYVVDEIVSATLAPLVENKSIKEILELKIVDPAMGSGHFLLGTVRFLEEQILERLSREKSMSNDPKAVAWEVLHSCIFGIDINPLAVELAKFSLWIYTARPGYSLEPLDDQLKHEDSLSHNTKWNRLFDFGRTDGFHAVVGNPPWGAKLKDDLIKQLTTRFPEVADYESAQYFMSLTIKELLKDGGRFGLIVPNTVALNVFARNFRDEVIKHSSLEAVIDLSQRTVFADASVRSIVFVGDRGSTKRKTIKIVSFKKDGTQTQSTEAYEKLKTEETWTFLSNAGSGLGKIIERLKRDCGVLADFFEVKQGYIPYRTSTLERRHGKQKAAEIVEKRLWHSEKRESKECQKELQGKDVERFEVNWSGTWVKYGDWVSTHLPLDVFSGPRILIREITGKAPYIIKAAITEEVYVNNPSILIARPNAKTPALEFFLGILNSKPASAIFQSVAPKAKKGLFPKVLITDAKRLLIPKIDLSKKQQKELHDEIVSCVRKLEKAVTKLTNFKQESGRASLEMEVEEHNRILDSLAYRAYGLSSSEVASVEEFLGEFVKDSPKEKKKAA